MSFYQTGGILGSDAPSYVERHADQELFAGLMDGQFCYVLTARQMGKSSLMVRTCTRLRAEGVKVATIDPTAVGTQNVTPDQWYHGLLDGLGQELDLEDELETFWRASLHLGPLHRLMKALRHVVLARLEREEPAKSGATPAASGGEEEEESNNVRLVICVDEIDSVRSLPFKTDEFFAAIRECYNHRPLDPAYRRLTFCLLGVATPSDLIQDAGTTPFNVGRGIELNDFTPSEAAPLARGLQIEDSPEAVGRSHEFLERILYWTEGQPYLTQKLCRVTADALRGKAAGGPLVAAAPHALVDQICNELFFAPGAPNRDDNLVFVRDRLLDEQKDRSELLHVYRKVWQGRKVKDDELDPMIKLLRLSGVARVKNRRLCERNPIYQRVFNKEWIRSNMPDAELRRQREAYRRGVIWATSVGSVVVTIMGLLVLVALREVKKQREASAVAYSAQAQAQFMQARITRMSGRSGQRVDSVSALRKAAAHYTNKTSLRDEAIACVSLMDLQETNLPAYLLKGTNVFGMSLDFRVSAVAEPNGSITIRTMDSGNALGVLSGNGGQVRQLHFCSSRPFLAVVARSDAENQLAVWDWKERKVLFAVAHGVHAGALDFSRDGQKLAVGQADGRISVFTLPSGTLEYTNHLRLNTGLPRAPQVLRFSPSGALLAESCLEDFNVQIWNLESAQPVRLLYHRAEVYDVTWDPKGEVLATACRDAFVYLWQLDQTNTLPKKLSGHESAVWSVAYNHNGTVLASLGKDQTVRLWTPVKERQLIHSSSDESAGHLMFTRDDRRLVATPDGQRRVRVWAVLGGEYLILDSRTESYDRLKSLDFSPDGSLLGAMSGECATIWDAASGKELTRFDMESVRSAAFASDSRHVLASTDKGLRQYPLLASVNNAELCLRTGGSWPLSQLPDELGAMALNPQRSSAAVVRHDEVLFVDLEKPSRTRVLELTNHYQRIAIHPGGSWLAGTPPGASSLHLWDISEQSRPRGPISIPGDDCFVFSPDGTWLATCWSGGFQFYRVGAWDRPVFSIPRAIGSNLNAPIAFAHHGRIVALADSPHTITLHRLDGDTPTRHELIATLEAPEASDRSPLELLAFSPNNTRLAAATKDRTIRLWNLALIGDALIREGLAELNLHQRGTPGTGTASDAPSKN